MNIVIPEVVELWLSNQRNHIELEIGFGTGDFLVNLADFYPEKKFIGVEIQSGFCAKANILADSQNVKNVHFLHGDGRAFLELVPNSRLDAIHFYFPSPADSLQYESPFLFNADDLDFVENIFKKLCVGGICKILTDSKFYFKNICHLFSEFKFVVREWQPYPMHNIPEGYLIDSECERYYREKSGKINKICFIK